MKNRLKLDFSLETAEERNNFLSTYLVQFDTLTPEEAETIANYLLWGKENGQPLGHDVQLETRWTRSNEIDSLDEYRESPTYLESQIHPLSDATLYKVPRQTFNRAAARKEAPPQLLPVYESLWKHIDYVDLLINYYELLHGKRKNPPRDELLVRFTEDERYTIQEEAAQLNQRAYLKLRHQIIDLRSEQFTIQDSYKTTINAVVGAPQLREKSTIVFETDVPVLPLGLCTAPPPFEYFFEPNFNPAHLSEKELWKISDFLQKKKEEEKLEKKIDFRNLETVYQIYLLEEEIQEELELVKEEGTLENNLRDLIETLHYYEREAGLTETQLRILELKRKHWKNQDIADLVNKEFGKSYTANYISTIFRQKIIKKINETAAFHLENVENWFYPENFKVCVDCGRPLLLHERNWVRKARSKDGFQNRCKCCEKKRKRR